ncbi:hypothetical protein S7711_09284 [Stachybotrys chartarum IBT 7711]|uniref:T6SS Phospholipase effector Tle1-like catalytic domain-containing protein n=1 Tax=Stachybotrys chartarum (strain CBS 109288 / IBT 7711) TaxID=1280523 RepID=A0A084AJL4_STACB|nr:hypothetical protein S7711_09284 [Stachybotrys chartarum IBT 7711]
MPGHVSTKRFYIFDGTWCDRSSPGKPTILSSIVDIIQGKGREIRYFPGPGTRKGLAEKYIGGGLGRGIKTQIIEAIDHLVTNYSPGDEIVFICFSRGAYTGRSVVGFLDRLGIPECNKDVLHMLYDTYTSGQLRQRGVADHLRVKYKCRQVHVQALICVDTVGSLDIPYSGIYGVFKIIFPFIKKQDFMETNVSSVVQRMRHALALHEYRGSFEPTMMHVPENRGHVLQQVWFLGSHADIGRDRETGSLGDIILAWILQQLQDIPGMTFKEELLRVRFPRSSNPICAISDADRHDWVHDPIKRSKTGIWHLLGTKTRQPGKYAKSGMVTNEWIHPTVRIRNYGMGTHDPVIKGYSHVTEPNGRVFWESGNMHNGGGSSNEVLRVPEAPWGDLEAYLLGIELE